ncbi:hypothetical protein GP486_000505 [Trichoglossum hirsutum]|uniref:Protein kinase domain-containing protein n=1 Tax=Trichoglossum hirsutum TaxID=265104 RepID=A0A9P8LIN0_9PEZI|nr:hypothetical protein GP486_000505 [Trichoglossum hirsutum]
MSEPDYKALFLAGQRQLAEEQQKREAAEAAAAEEQRKREAAEAAVADEQQKREAAVAEEQRKTEAAVAEEQQKREAAVAEEQQKRQSLEERTRSTTLLEFLDMCHTYVGNICSAETDSRLTTNGDIPNPVGKKYPDNIRPWLDFTSIQRTIVTRLLSCYPLDNQPQVFMSRHTMQEQRIVIPTRLTSEKDTELVCRPLVISPIYGILKHLTSLPSVCQEFHLDSHVCFFNHLNPLKNAAAAKADTESYVSSTEIANALSSLPAATQSDSIHQPDQPEQLPSNRPKTPDSYASDTTTPRGQPDIICFRFRTDTTSSKTDATSSNTDATSSSSKTDATSSNTDDTPSGNMTFTRLVLPIELKPPHKLTRVILKRGLRQMDLLSDVININKIPSDKDARNQQEAERRVAATTAQLFSYMIEGGVEYGIVATGEAFVFLHVDLEDPGTLYYHLLDPTTDIPEQIHGNDLLYQSTLGQILAFMLLALESSHQSELLPKQDTITAALDELSIWPNAPTQDTSPSAVPPRSPSPNSPPYRPPQGHRKISNLPARPALTRNSKSKSSCVPYGGYFTRQKDEPEDPSPPDLNCQSAKAHTIPITSKEGTSTSSSGGTGNSKSSSSSSRRPTRERERQQDVEMFYPYCSPSCILGLTDPTLFLDPGCPNYKLHCDFLRSNNLRFGRYTFLSLLQAQLHDTRDRYIYPLGIQGAVGVVFKVVLRGSGYVVIAKGSVGLLKDHLAYESYIYTHLKPLQGICIPVCLGLVHLSKPYYYDIGVQIEHLLLLSYGGEPLPAHIASIISDDRWWASDDVSQSVDAVIAHGVDHQDVRVPNLLWNKSCGRVVVIDFERAVVVKKNQNQKGKRKRLLDV